MKLSDYTLSLLEDIERRIDPDTEDDYYNQWKRFWNGELTDPVFVQQRKTLSQPGIELRKININDAMSDFELMLDKELGAVSFALSKSRPALGVRANYGTGIMTSVFGAEIFEMAHELDTLPTTKPLDDDAKIDTILDKGIPDLYTGFGRKVFGFGEYCAEIFEKYPKIKKYVSVYHPDTQGPLDIADLLWGMNIFYEMYDDPDRVHALLRLITDTYKLFMEKWFGLFPCKDELSLHWSYLHKGNIFLRLDSAMNLSREFYEAFSKPYDTELFEHFGGGCMHFCGRADHYIESLCDTESLCGIQMSQPELNDMGKIIKALESNQKRVIGLKNASDYVSAAGVHGCFVNG